MPHALCQAGDWDAVVAHFIQKERKIPGKAKDATREIRDFYTQPEDCLWITFEDHRLWWAFAKPGVTWLGGDGSEHGYRSRQTVDGWRDHDLKGQQLKVSELSSRLTMVAGYQQTICGVKAVDHLLRRIRGEEEPSVAKAKAAKLSSIEAAHEMIVNLDQSDFEVLVDLIFAKSGWQRISRLGGNMADADLLVRDAATDEVALVQVKSQATQAVLDNYIGRFDAAEVYDRMFFVCHSPKGALSAPPRSELHVWAGKSLAEAAIRAGLYDWLIEKSA